MIVSNIFEHKTELGLGAIGCGLGAFIGNRIYKNTPSNLVNTVYSNGKNKDLITDHFINCVVSSYKKDLFSRVDAHTERSWFQNQIAIMKKSALEAKADPSNRWHFQQIYDLGSDLLSGKIINSEDIGLARKGADAISYGRKLQKTKMITAGMLIVGGIFVLGGFVANKFKKNDKNTK